MIIKLEKGEYQRVVEIIQCFIEDTKIDSTGDIQFPDKASTVADNILAYLSIE